MRQLFHTDESRTGLVLGLSLGLVMFPQGARKLLGW
jgi:putative oxidoreductase